MVQKIPIPRFHIEGLVTTCDRKTKRGKTLPKKLLKIVHMADFSLTTRLLHEYEATLAGEGVGGKKKEALLRG